MKNNVRNFLFVQALWFLLEKRWRFCLPKDDKIFRIYRVGKEVTRTLLTTNSEILRTDVQLARRNLPLLRKFDKSFL